jgi:hypothetical protein
MPKRSSRIELTVHRKEAERVLRQAIERGQQIANRSNGVRDEPTFTEWAADATRWSKYAVAAVHSISKGEALEEELRAAIRAWLTSLAARRRASRSG